MKKFNEYFNDEMDRKEWPGAPELKPSMTDKEKLYALIDIYHQCDRGKISPEEMFSQMGEVIGVNKTFPGSKNL